MGARSCDFSLRCTSICETRMPGDRGGDRHPSRLGAAHAVEDGDLIVGGNDFAECDQRRADEIDAAHQFFFAVGIDAVDDGRTHVEGVG